MSVLWEGRGGAGCWPSTESLGRAVAAGFPVFCSISKGRDLSVFVAQGQEPAGSEGEGTGGWAQQVGRDCRGAEGVAGPPSRCGRPQGRGHSAQAGPSACRSGRPEREWTPLREIWWVRLLSRQRPLPVGRWPSRGPACGGHGARQVPSSFRRGQEEVERTFVSPLC